MDGLGYVPGQELPESIMIMLDSKQSLSYSIGEKSMKEFSRISYWTVNNSVTNFIHL